MNEAIVHPWGNGSGGLVQCLSIAVFALDNDSAVDDGELFNSCFYNMLCVSRGFKKRF